MKAFAKAEYGFHAVYTGLAVVLVIAAFAAGLAGPWKAQAAPITVTKTVAPSTAAKLVEAWGQPDQSIDGGQISPQLQGATCVVYQSKQAVLCYVP